MYKDAHNRILNLPRGTPAKAFWMLVFSLFLLLLGSLAIGGLGGIVYVLFKAFFK